MAQNARTAGQERDINRYFSISGIATLLVFVVAFFLPKRQPGDCVLPVLYASAMGYWCQKVQGDLLTGGRFPGAVRASWWTTVGFSLLIVVFLLALFASIVLAIASMRGVHA
jgi:hypothetical protein